jgi:hypothetical protein
VIEQAAEGNWVDRHLAASDKPSIGTRPRFRRSIMRCEEHDECAVSVRYKTTSHGSPDDAPEWLRGWWRKAGSPRIERIEHSTWGFTPEVVGFIQSATDSVAAQVQVAQRTIVQRSDQIDAALADLQARVRPFRRFWFQWWRPKG